MIGRDREDLHQIRTAPVTPRGIRDRAALNLDPETSEHANRTPAVHASDPSAVRAWPRVSIARDARNGLGTPAA